MRAFVVVRVWFDDICHLDEFLVFPLGSCVCVLLYWFRAWRS